MPRGRRAGLPGKARPRTARILEQVGDEASAPPTAALAREAPPAPALRVGPCSCRAATTGSPRGAEDRAGGQSRRQASPSVRPSSRRRRSRRRPGRDGGRARCVARRRLPPRHPTMIGASARSVTRCGPSTARLSRIAWMNRVAPLASGERRRLREPVGEVLIECEHHRALVRKVPIEQSGADAGPGGDVAKGRRLIPALADERDRRVVEPATGGVSLGSPAGRPAPFARLAIFSKHVYHIKHAR